ncbi:MAG: hypothetical protein ABJC13_14390 [Acidobacteriota bacterium]
MKHSNFSPRLVEFAIRRAEVPDSEYRDLRSFMLDVLNDPASLWDHAFKSQLSTDAQTILLGMLFLPAATPLDDLVAAVQSLSLNRNGRYLSGIEFMTQLKNLEGSFVAIDALRSGERSAKYFTPAVTDYLLGVLQESNGAEIQAIVESAVFFEQLLGIWGAAEIRDKNQGTTSPVKYPQLAVWFQRHATILVEAFERTWRLPSCVWKQQFLGGEPRFARTPVSLEARLQKVIEIGSSISEALAWAELRVEELALAWRSRVGDRAAAAALVGLGALVRLAVVVRPSCPLKLQLLPQLDHPVGR